MSVPVHPRPLLSVALFVVGAGWASGVSLLDAQTLPPVTADAAAMAKAQSDSARYPYTAADIHFVTGMISHHSQAIVMAGWAPTHGAGAAVRRLCERIVNAQVDEIVLMQRWLADRRQPVPVPDFAMLAMGHSGGKHMMTMPGMLTEAQMRELDRAQGTRFDILFLQLMIQHHKGAVTMVGDLFAAEGGRDLAVFKFASDINVDQTTEIRRMQRMLTDLLLTEATHP